MIEDDIAKLSEEEREILLTRLFEDIDTDALIQNVEKHWFATMGERLKKENERLMTMIPKAEALARFK